MLLLQLPIWLEVDLTTEHRIKQLNYLGLCLLTLKMLLARLSCKFSWQGALKGSTHKEGKECLSHSPPSQITQHRPLKGNLMTIQSFQYACMLCNLAFANANEECKKIICALADIQPDLPQMVEACSKIGGPQHIATIQAETLGKRLEEAFAPQAEDRPVTYKNPHCS